MQYNELIETKEQQLIDVLKRQLKKAVLQLEAERDTNEVLNEHLNEMKRVHENNMNVIEQIEHENEAIKQTAMKIKRDSDAKDRIVNELNDRLSRTATNHTDQMGRLKNQIQLVMAERDRMQKQLLSKDTHGQQSKKAIERLQLKHKIELQQVTQFAAQKVKNEESYHSKAINNLRNETDRSIRQLKMSNECLMSENKRLMESLNSLKESSMEKQSQLNEKIDKLERVSKESDYCRQIYEQELENVKSTSASWEQTLKDKLKSLQNQKEQLLQQFAEYKQHRKSKTTELKKQFADRIEQISAEKAKMMRRYEDVVRQIKIQNEKLSYANQQLKKQVTDFQKHKKQLQEEAENRYHLFMKNVEQDKRTAKNEVEIKEGKIIDLNRQLSETLKSNAQLKVIVEKLRFTTQTRNNEYETLKLEFNKFKNETRSRPKETNKEVVEGPEYSKYFSQDMGPIDDMWFERKSGLKKEIKQDTILKDIYDTKRNEVTQKENIELKDIVSRMSREMQDTRDTFSLKIDLKDKEIKLTKDQIYMLKDRLHEKDQQIMKVKEKLNQGQVQLARLQERCKHMKDMEDQYKQTKEALEHVEQDLNKIRSQVQQTQHYNQVLLQERQNLIAISSELRAQINYYQQHTHHQPPSELLGISSNKLGDKRHSQEADVSEINRLLDANNIQSELYFAERSKKQQRRISPVHQNAVQPTNKKPQSLMNLIKQRKNLMKQESTRPPINLELAAQQARIHQNTKQRPYQQTSSQKEVYNKLRNKSKQKYQNTQAEYKTPGISN